jgi:predicted GIY-YIG superfamily endonuclease
VPAYCEVFDSAEEARRRECAIKKMTRAQKETLIAACADIEARLSLFLPK